MPTIPIKESGNNFSHTDANVPFAVESATYTGGSDTLTVNIGAGRMKYGTTTYELTASTTAVDQTPVTASTTYYVVIDFNAGSPQLDITTTAKASSTDQDHTYICSVSVDGAKSVDTITDLRGFMEPDYPRVGDGTAASPAYSFENYETTGLYINSATNKMAISVGGTGWGYFDISSGESRIHLGNENNDYIYYDPSSENGGFVRNGTQQFGWGNNFVSAVRIRVGDGSRSSPSIAFTSDTDTGIFHDASLNRLIHTVDRGGAGPSIEGSTITTQSAFVPGTDNSFELGNATFRWDNIWATNGTINTSDPASKEDIQDADEEVIPDLVDAFRVISFRRPGGTRRHYGFDADNIVAALSSAGINTQNFAPFVDPTVNPPDPVLWPEAYEADGVTLKQDRTYKGLRYGELIPLAFLALRVLRRQARNQLQALDARITALENA